MIGSQIGPYSVVRLLGKGGMGAVYEGVNETIERRVAIKVLHPGHASNQQILARFFNEARAVNRVAHPCLVQVQESGQLPDGTAYIVMEFLAGESVSERLARCGGRLPFKSALQLAWQVAAGLAAAHEKNIIHRDLKPANLMLVPDPLGPGGERVKILDFGIAKLIADTRASDTVSNIMMGTPTYMSPEQCRHAGAVDDKSDVYALGVMLFQFLAGHPPFEANGSMELIGMHLFEPPPPLASLVPEVPPELADFIHQMLSKERAPRPSMREVALRLAEMAEKVALPVSEPPPGRPSVRLSVPADAPSPDEAKPAPAAARSESPAPEAEAPPKTELRAVERNQQPEKRAQGEPAPGAQGSETRKTPAVLAITASRPVPAAQETGPWQAWREIDRRVLIAAAAGVLGLAAVVIWRVAGSSSASARQPGAERGIAAVPVVPPPAAAGPAPRPAAEIGRAPAGVDVATKPGAPPGVAPGASPPVATPAIATTSAPAAAPSKSREQVERILGTAMTSYINGQYRQAIEGARSVQKQNPLRAWRIIGISACGSKNLSLVTESYRNLDKLGRQNVVFACDKAGIRYTAGRFKLSD